MVGGECLLGWGGGGVQEDRGQYILYMVVEYIHHFVFNPIMYSLKVCLLTGILISQSCIEIICKAVLILCFPFMSCKHFFSSY